MAVNALQAAIDNGADKRQGAFVKYFDEVSPIFRDAPMVHSEQGLFYDYETVTSVGGITWRPINGTITEASGTTNPTREYLKILSREINCDQAFIRTQPTTAGIKRHMKKQTEMAIQALSNEFDRTFFEGSELADPNEMVGLRSRLSGNQAIQMASGGGALTLAAIHQLIDAVPFVQRQWSTMRRGEGMKCCLYMNRTLRRKMTALIEAQTGSMRIETEKNAWGMQVEKFGGCEIKVMETMGSAATILDFDENPGDGVSDCASIYCVAWGEEAVHGLYAGNGNLGGGEGTQFFYIDKFEPRQASPVYGLRLEGYFGVAVEHPRAAARLYAILNA